MVFLELLSCNFKNTMIGVTGLALSAIAIIVLIVVQGQLVGKPNPYLGTFLDNELTRYMSLNNLFASQLRRIMSLLHRRYCR